MIVSSVIVASESHLPTEAIDASGSSSGDRSGNTVEKQEVNRSRKLSMRDHLDLMEQGRTMGGETVLLQTGCVGRRAAEEGGEEFLARAVAVRRPIVERNLLDGEMVEQQPDALVLNAPRKG